METPQQHTWTVEDDLFIFEQVGSLSFEQIGLQLGLTRHQVRNRYMRIRARLVEAIKQMHGVAFKVAGEDRKDAVVIGEDDDNVGGDGETKVIHLLTHTTRDIETLLKEAKVDLTKWRIKDSKIRKWDQAAKIATRQNGMDKIRDIGVTELWYVAVTLVPREDVKVLAIRDEIIEELKQYCPAPVRLQPSNFAVSEPLLFEPCFMDHHFGKFAMRQEVGVDVNLELATDRWWNAVDEMLSLASVYKINRILFPVGNDLFHIDNKGNATTKGTLLDASTRWPVLFKHVRQLVVATIEKFVAIAPVDVQVVWGNHDMHTTFCLGDSLECYFHNQKYITIDNTPVQRKYYRYGTNLIGFTHGDEETAQKLVGLMPLQVPDLWAATRVREWQVGHTHVAALKNPLMTLDAVKVRVLPSLCGPDVWHDSKGFLSMPQAEAYLWHETLGYKGHFTSTAIAEPGGLGVAA